MGQKRFEAGLKDVTLDSFIISATPYEELKPLYGDGKWSVQQFGDAHILFELTKNYEYIEKLFT